MKYESSAPPLTLFEVWLADVVIWHHRSCPGTEALAKRLHEVAELVRDYGADEVFGPRDRSMTADEKARALGRRVL